MKKFIKFIGITSLSVMGMSAMSVQALTDTNLTKVCKPLIDTTKKPPKVALQGLPERVHKRMNRALEAMAEDRYDEAIEQLKSLLKSARQDYVKANVNLNLAYAHAQKGDQNGSLPYFKEALKFGETSLPHDRVQGLRINVASLMYGIDEKDESLEMMMSWLKNAVAHDNNAYYMIAALRAEKGDMKNAICPSYWAVKTSESPKKNYYQALMAFHWELKDVAGTASLLKDMITLFPEEKSYWRQLSQVYFELEKIDEALAIMEMFYVRGEFDKDDDYSWLSTLFALRDIPYRSAEVLEEGLNKGLVESDKKNWGAVAQNYHISNELEKAVKAYGKTAELSETGTEYLKQAEILSDDEQYKEAITAFDKALEKGGLKTEEQGRAYFRKGTTLVNMGRCDAGMNVLEQAQKFKKFRRQAEQWVIFAEDRKKHKKC